MVTCSNYFPVMHLRTSLPTYNTAADCVINQSSTTAATTGVTQTLTNTVQMVVTDGVDLYACDRGNKRLCIYKNIEGVAQFLKPMDCVVGQTSYTVNTGTSVLPYAVCIYKNVMMIANFSLNNFTIYISN